MKPILITGGLGYLGGRLVQYLRSRPGAAAIRCLTRRPQDHLPSWANGLIIVSGDIMDAEVLGRAVEGVDTVIHLAAPNEIESARDPEGAITITGFGTRRLLEACRKSGVARFIYFSTIHAYGPGLHGVVTEAQPARPVHPYAVSHRLAEDFVLGEARESGMLTWVFRLSNGYGCPADPAVNRWTLVFNDLCRQAVRDKRLVLRSSGRQRRDFISLHNVARAVHHVLGLPVECWGDGLYNLGGECCLSIRDVAARVVLAYQQWRGETLEIRTGTDAQPGRSDDFVYSIDKFKATGFALVDNMEEEIGRTLELCERECTRGTPCQSSPSS